LVTPDNQSRVYGAANPTLTASLSRWVNNDNSSVVSGSPAVSTTAGSSSPVGNYPISASQGTLSAANYTFTFATGTLTVNPAALIATANNTNRIYGQTNPALTTSITGFVAGDTAAVISGQPVLSVNASNGSPVGNYSISVGLGSLTAANYNFSGVNGVLTVTPAPLLVAANNAQRPYGQTNPALAGTIVGLMNQDPITASYATTAQTNSPAGTYTITPALVDPQGLVSNYALNLSNGTLTVTAALLLSTTPLTVMVGRGPARCWIWPPVWPTGAA
jgi:type IV secretory pathway protease TraF